MATTNIQPLRSVRSRMEYTLLGNGERRRSHIEAGTDRIAGRLGDFERREDFTRYCEAIAATSRRRVEGFELRVSFDDLELSRLRSDDVALAVEHGYRLAKAVAPDSPCDVTAHTDGEGGKLHVHVVIANIDERTGRALAHGMNHRRVSFLNDEVCRDEGLSVPGARSELWRDKRKDADEFERALGDRVYAARRRAHDVPSFVSELGRLGVELRETRKTASDGTESVGWSYRMRYPDRRSGRLRRRAASRLAGEFSRERIETHFSVLEAARELSPSPGPSQADAPGAKLVVSDELVSMAASDVALERGGQLKLEGAPVRPDFILSRSEEVADSPDETARLLRDEVERARERFKDAKNRERSAGKGPTAWGFAAELFRLVGRTSADPFSRIVAIYLREWAADRDRLERSAQLASAKADTYAARGSMWDAEKRARAAGVAIAEFRSAERERRSRRVFEKGEELELEAIRQRQRQRDRQFGG